MKGKTLAITAVAVATVLGATAFVTNSVSAGGPGWHWNAFNQGQATGPGGMGYGPGMMGYGHGRMGGPAMMGYGHQAGFGGPCLQEQATLNKALTTIDVTKWVERHLDRQGNDRLKAGPVTEKDADTIVADVVTVDGALVWRFEFDRATGRMSPVD